jgi:periplasmic protein TonB
MQTKIQSKGLGLSLLFHGLLLLGFFPFVHQRVLPVRPPGSITGTIVSLSYLPGKSTLQPKIRVKTRHHPVKSPSLVPDQSVVQAKLPEVTVDNVAVAPSQPSSEVGNDAFGDGDVNIALAQFFPYPQPDLSKLPRGTSGDVVLDAVIDANGRISKLTMVHGLGYGIDETVLAAVQQWIFKPATKNGTPVVSEQELHFHYEHVG